MFKSKDVYATVKGIAEIAVRRGLANNPKYAMPLKLICQLVSAGEVDDLVDMVAKNNPKLFSKDPLLAADIKTIVGILGLADVKVDNAKLNAVTAHICGMI